MGEEQSKPRKYALTVGGRPHEVTLSGGRILLPVHGRKIHHDPACGHLTDSAELKTFPDDPEGLLWWRLLDAVDPAAFARGVGLVNSQNQPLDGLCSCVLRPVSAARAALLPYCPVEWAAEVFDAERHRAAAEAAEREAELIRGRFPFADWEQLPLERYALGQGTGSDAYSYVIEYGSARLGSITGGSAMKHLVYRRTDGSWWHDSRYKDAAEAWTAVRAGIVEAVRAARDGRVGDIDSMAAVRAGNTVVAKTLHVYANGSVLPLYADNLARHFVALLADGVPQMRPFERKAHLKELFERTGVPSGWSPDLAARFLLWWAPPLSAPRTVRIDTAEQWPQWPDWLAHGHLAVARDGDDVGDLHRFADRDEFTEACAGRPGLTDLWEVLVLRPGDRVVATSGNARVLAVGRVTDDGYHWDPDGSEPRHTVSVQWDETYATVLEPPVAWRPGFLAEVKPAVWERIAKARSKSLAAAGQEEAAEAVADGSPLDPVLQRIGDALDRRGQAVLYGPPGTGKTYEALRYAVRRIGELADDLPGVRPYAEPGEEAFRATHRALVEADRLTMVTFHPGYGYEDFIEGLRPVKGEAGLSLEVRDGVFKRVCARAEQDPGHTYLVLVDELNRGNLPKIFGELITLLEKDKRGYTVTLPLSGDHFSVPPNVQLLGTMNTADRSIRMLDSAIRRRFAFLELLPNTEPLTDAVVGQLDLKVFLTELNARIRAGLDREKQIGQAFLLPGGEPISTPEELAAVIRDEILPLLQEYAYDDYGLLAGFLGTAVIDPVAHTPRELDDEKLVSALYEELQVKAHATQPE
ncbi:AAA family ATPase [Streptomyces sp. NRRL F-2580]|uniref:AAA family ATPase n=1 Tax=Streptomyces sp. NRRL F-2580 TaxID=1463841 RepID=UPI0004C789CD|nr:AAA family ATPase [Streptomyces sp. NRRL F-2580]